MPVCRALLRGEESGGPGLQAPFAGLVQLIMGGMVFQDCHLTRSKYAASCHRDNVPAVLPCQLGRSLSELTHLESPFAL